MGKLTAKEAIDIQTKANKKLIDADLKAAFTAIAKAAANGESSVRIVCSEKTIQAVSASLKKAGYAFDVSQVCWGVPTTPAAPPKVCGHCGNDASQYIHTKLAADRAIKATTTMAVEAENAQQAAYYAMPKNERIARAFQLMSDQLMAGYQKLSFRGEANLVWGGNTYINREIRSSVKALLEASFPHVAFTEASDNAALWAIRKR